MNILIVNQHTLNYGDDIAGVALIQQLLERFNDIKKIDIIYNTQGSLEYPDSRVHDRDDISLKNIGMLQIFIFIFFSLFHLKIVFNKSLRKLKKCVEEAEYIFVSPCGANLGIYQDWRFLLKLVLIVGLGGKPIFHNNTIGYSNNRIFNILENKVLKKSVIYVREERSYKLLIDKGYSPIRSVDTGFLFQDESKKDNNLENYVTFVPTQLNNWHPDFRNLEVDLNSLLLENVIDPLIRLADKKKLNIVILKHMHSSGEESELINFFRKEIESRTLSDIDVLVPEIENCYEYSAVIKNSSFVLSMRYHGVVMAIKNGVPFLSLGYENKMQEVCNYSGFENNNIFIKRITDKSIDFEELLEKAPMQYEKNSERLDSLKRIASFALDNIEFSRNGYIKNGK